MAWESRGLHSAGTPTAWKGEPEELEKYGVNVDLGKEPRSEHDSIYSRGMVMRASSLQSTVRLGLPKNAPTAWDDRDWNGEFLSLLEEPLFTPQDVRTKHTQLTNLRAAFVKRHFHTIRILTQERTFKYHYKTIKPIVVTSTSFGYLANNAFFKVQHDIKSRFSANETKATAAWMRQEMYAAANASTASQTVIASPLFALVDWCGVRILISSVIPGAPWSEAYVQGTNTYTTALYNCLPPKEVAYRWVAKEAIQRHQTPIKKGIPLIPSEVMQLTVGKKDYVLRIRFKMWKNRIQGLKWYRYALLCARDKDVVKSLRDVGPYNGWEQKMNSFGKTTGPGGAKSEKTPVNTGAGKTSKGKNKQKEKDYRLKGTIGVDRGIEILRGSDCRYYIASCSTLRPPMAPLNVVHVVAAEKKKRMVEEAAVAVAAAAAEVKAEVEAGKAVSGTNVDGSSDHPTEEEKTDVKRNEKSIKNDAMLSNAWELPTISLVAKFLPHQMSEPETIISVPWYSMNDPSALIAFIETHIGVAHDTGGYIETREGDLMFWCGSKRSLPNRRASVHAQRELSGNAMLLPQYTATHVRHRWRDDSFKWRRDPTNQVAPIHPSVFRYPTKYEIPTPIIEDQHDQHSPVKVRRRRGSAIMQKKAAAAQVSEVLKSMTSVVATKRLTVETLSFLEHAVFATANDLERVLDQQIKSKVGTVGATPNVGDVRPYKVVASFRKFGLPLRYLGLVRQSTSSVIVREALLEEGTARIFKHYIAACLRKLSCFVSDNTAEDPMKHLGKSTRGSNEEDDLLMWFEHHQYQTIAHSFNLLLGHGKGTGKIAEEWSDKQKIELMLAYPSVMSDEELLQPDIYLNVLRNDTSRIRLFKRAQELTGCAFFRHLSGNKKVKAQYIEAMTKKLKYPKRLFTAIRGSDEVAKTLDRLNTKRMTLEHSLGKEHPLHLQILNRIASVHSVTGKGLVESNKLYALAVQLAKRGHGTSSATYVNTLLAHGEFLTKIGQFNEALIPLNQARVGLDGALGVGLARVYRAIGQCSIELGYLLSSKQEDMDSTITTAANDDSSGQKCIENAKQIMDDIFGYGKVEIITSYLLAAELMCLTNRTKEAGIVLAKAQDTCQCSLGVHPDHAYCFYMKAMVGLAIGEHQNILLHLKTAHLMYKDTLGSDSLEYKKTSVLTAKAQFVFGDYVGMAESIQKAEEIVKHRLTMKTYAWAECLVLRAQQYIHQGNYIVGCQYIKQSQTLLTELFTVARKIVVDDAQQKILNAISAARSDLSPTSRKNISRGGATGGGASSGSQRIVTPLDCVLLRLSSSVHYDFGRTAMAEKDLLMARKYTEFAYGSHSPMLGDVLVELARLRLNQGKLDQSEILCQQALHCYKDLVQESDPRVGQAKIEFGNVLSTKADYVPARQYCCDGLEILVKACGLKHRYVGRARMVLGELYINIREDTLALNELRQCVHILEQCHGRNHVYVCRALGVYSRALSNLCEFQEANIRLEHADQEMVKFMRHDSGDGGGGNKGDRGTGNSGTGNSGTGNSGTGNSGTFLAVSTTVTTTTTAAVVSYNVDTNLSHVSIVVDFACLYFEEARYDETHDLLMRAMPLARVLVGKEHPVTQRVLQMMGKLHGTLAHYSQAHDSFETSIILARNIYGSHHPYVFRACLCDVEIYLLQGKFIETSLKIKELKAFEPLPSPVDAANLRVLEGEYQLCLGRHKKALDLMMSGLSMLNARYSTKPASILPLPRKAVESHLLCAWAGCRVGNTLMEWERWSDAESMLSSARDSFAMFDSELSHPRLADILWRHGYCLHKLGMNNSDITTSTATVYDVITNPRPKYRTETFVNKHGHEKARTVSFRDIDVVANDVCRDEMILAKQIMDNSLGPKHPRFADMACALAEYHTKAGLDLWSKKLYEQACDVRRTML
jgi:tetratricopeptide (TPR) repeat protein